MAPDRAKCGCSMLRLGVSPQHTYSAVKLVLGNQSRSIGLMTRHIQTPSKLDGGTAHAFKDSRQVRPMQLVGS